MKYNAGKRVFFLTVSLFLITSSLFLLSDADLDPAYNAQPVQMITPLFPSKTDTMIEKELIFYPKAPAPGDYLIIEASPVYIEDDAKVIIDFTGTISDYYQPGGILYAVIAISYETEPGTYNLRIETAHDKPGSAYLEMELAVAEKEFRVSHFSMPPGTTAGWTTERLAEDREKIRIAREKTEEQPLWQNSFLNPLEGRISSEYGAIRYINNNPPRRHSGIDIATEEGEPIVATNSGLVRLSEFLLSGGNTVIIDHGIGLSSTYMHLHTLAVEEGELVKRSQKIGTVGMTGYATGPHLHWEVNIGQTPVNPEQLFDNELLLIPPAYVVEKVKAW